VASGRPGRKSSKPLIFRFFCLTKILGELYFTQTGKDSRNEQKYRLLPQLKLQLTSQQGIIDADKEGKGIFVLVLVFGVMLQLLLSSSRVILQGRGTKGGMCFKQASLIGLIIKPNVFLI